MPEYELIHCLNCKSEHPQNLRACDVCGASLIPARVTLYLDRAEADIHHSRYGFARANMSKADLEMLRLSGDERKRFMFTARAFWLQGLTYFYKGLIDEAREELLLAYQNLEGQAHAERLSADVLNMLGNIEYYHEHLDSAAEYYRRSSVAAAAVEAHTLAARSLANLANVCSEQGQLEQAGELYDNAIAQAELGDEPNRLADTYRLATALYLKAGPFDKAREYAEKALALSDQIDSQATLCRVLSDVSNVYLKSGDLERAEQYLQQSQDLAQRSSYRLMQSANQIFMCELVLTRGDYESLFQYAMQAFSQTGEAVFYRAEAALYLMRYYLMQQDWSHARRYLQFVEDTYNTSSSDRDRIFLTHGRALLAAALGEWEEADRYFTTLVELIAATRDLYWQATAEEEYAAALLRHPDPAAQARAKAALADAAAAFNRLGLPHRVATVTATVARLPSRVTAPLVAAPPVPDAA